MHIQGCGDVLPDSSLEIPKIPEPIPVKLEAKTSALILVDLQNDFLHPNGALYMGDGARRIINPVKILLDKASSRGVPVIYTQDWHPPDSPEFDIWPKHAVMDTWGSEIIEELKPVFVSFTVRKEVYDAFYGTGLDALLSLLKVKHLVVAGVVSNICVLHTVGSSALRGYKPYIPVDCIAALNDFDQLLTLRQISFLYKGVLTRSDLLDFY
ncbi:MAG: cysteine hydrolase [Candidatus Bathyarchaeota archaeon]|nr:cysteine hydrolase [Candidatus Bathyarchaeota archaeon]